MQRAKERQRKLQELTGVTPLKESNVSTENSTLATRKEVVSDSCLFMKEKPHDSPLKENSSEGNIMKYVRQNSKTHISSDMPGSPRNQLKTLNIQKDDFNMEIKVSSAENVRVEVQIEEKDDEGDDESGGEAQGLRENAKARLKRLGKLYAGEIFNLKFLTLAETNDDLCCYYLQTKSY